MMKLSAKNLIAGIACSTLFSLCAHAQEIKHSQPAKKISTDLFGIFFEDISYAADGGLYAELIQNRSFEYSPADRRAWNSFTAWDYTTDGFGYGSMNVETASPISPNNIHYAVLDIQDPGQKGVGLTNYGYDGIAVKAGESYNFSVFVKQVVGQSMPMIVSLQNKKGEENATVKFETSGTDWKKYSVKITATKTDDSAKLVLLATSRGTIGVDMVSLFPVNTFKNRPNGMRADLAKTIADLQPKFMRFPGGCLVHGDGLANMYRWKNTIGAVESRVSQRNIWNYHQTDGLGYYEYFLFCEDIGAKPLPVVAAAVSCQNSGGTWRIGGTGQKAIPVEEMQEYIDEVLDLIEYANGPATSEWGSKRAAAGHPEPFNLEYIGIGNEDKQTDVFRDRFKMIYDVVKAKHPEITIIGTVGPAPAGEDFELGWSFANKLNIPMVDEHYYERPEWFLQNNKRYDLYNRKQSAVYLGEYASRGNNLFNALAEASYMTALERNADVVKMSSYAPLLARQNHTSWNPNLIYFNGTQVIPTVNYYVQQLFSQNAGNYYYSNIVDVGAADTLLAASCVWDSKSGDLIVKLVNAGATAKPVKLNLSKLKFTNSNAILSVLTGDANAKNSFENPFAVVPVVSQLTVAKKFTYQMPAYSLSVIRIKSK